MTAAKSNRRVYSAEELHRLRSTVSYPDRLREAIEEHDGEDAELVKGKIFHPCTDATIDIIGKQTHRLASQQYAIPA